MTDPNATSTNAATTALGRPGDDVVGAVSRAVAQVLRRDPAEIRPDSRLFEDLELDSTSALELLMEIEEGVGVEFDMDTLEQHHFATISSLAAYVSAQLDAA
jgi:acyl carrier protein